MRDLARYSVAVERLQDPLLVADPEPSAAGLRNWRMCGLFTLRLPPKELAGILGLFREPDSGAVISWRSVNP